MKQMIYKILVIGLFVFSFYYTNQVVELLKEKDPLMKKIKEINDKYKIEAQNAQIVGNNIISGQKGKEIDYEKTYQNMKEYGTYNESLTVLKEIIPTISIENTYDKYLISGNRKNKWISLVFPIQDNINPQKIITLLNHKKIPATFFIDGNYLEQNILLIKNNQNHSFELLSYQQTYQEPFFKTALSYLENITHQKPKYCYSEKEQKELLNLCKKLKLHTIKPIIIIKKNAYQKIKENLSNGMIISLTINKELEKEIVTITQYIKEKGYSIVPLEQLLAE